MRICSRILLFPLVLLIFACGETAPKTPVETFKTYTRAISKKDTSAMKVLLSNATLAMHEREAKAQGVSVDEIISRETLFTPSQKSVEFKNEKIDGGKATLMVKNSAGNWETVPFVREDGVWKIDKAGYAEQMMKDVEDQQKSAFGDIPGVGSDPEGTPEDNGH